MKNNTFTKTSFTIFCRNNKLEKKNIKNDFIYKYPYFPTYYYTFNIKA